MHTCFTGRYFSTYYDTFLIFSELSRLYIGKFRLRVGAGFDTPLKYAQDIIIYISFCFDIAEISLAILRSFISLYWFSRFRLSSFIGTAALSILASQDEFTLASALSPQDWFTMTELSIEMRDAICSRRARFSGCFIIFDRRIYFARIDYFTAYAIDSGYGLHAQILSIPRFSSLRSFFYHAA